jgi:hypothetical protein
VAEQRFLDGCDRYSVSDRSRARVRTKSDHPSNPSKASTEPPSVAGRVVVTDHADGIRLTLYTGDITLAEYCCSAHLAVDLAGELIASARRRFGRAVRQ